MSTCVVSIVATFGIEAKFGKVCGLIGECELWSLAVIKGHLSNIEQQVLGSKHRVKRYPHYNDKSALCRMDDKRIKRIKYCAVYQSKR